MTSHDDIFNALIVQQRVVEQRLNYRDFERKLIELADWPHKVCNYQ